MKVSELVEGIRKACGGKDPAECLMRVGYPVEEYDIPWTVTDLDVDGPNDRDMYGAPRGKTANVDVRLDIDDFETAWPYTGLVSSGSGKLYVGYSIKWGADTPVVTAAGALAVLEKELETGPDKDICGLSEDGRAGVYGEVSGIRAETLKQPWPASPVSGAKKFSTWIVVFDGKLRTKASASDVEQYVETHEDEVRELAYDKWDADRRDTNDWADGALGESTGIKVWAHMLDEAMRDKTEAV